MACGQGVCAARERMESHTGHAAQPKALFGSLTPKHSGVPRSGSIQQLRKSFLPSDFSALEDSLAQGPEGLKLLAPQSVCFQN